MDAITPLLKALNDENIRHKVVEAQDESVDDIIDLTDHTGYHIQIALYAYPLVYALAYWNQEKGELTEKGFYATPALVIAAYHVYTKLN